MKFRDALLAGPDHGADRLPIETDRRLRRRLGLDAPASSRRRVWLRPAIATFAVAAVALAIFYYQQPSESRQRASGTVADSGASGTTKWANATIVAAPGTRMTTTTSNTLSLAEGAVQIERTDTVPMLVEVPMGRVVIAAYRSSVTVDRESVTILINDGTGHYVDADGQSHPLVVNAALVWPPPPTIPAPTPPPRKRENRTPASVAPAPASSPEQFAPPGETKSSIPPRPDAPCTFKSDCDQGQTCRKNERGESVCMGKGGEGAACWFDNDCVSQHCNQRRCASNP